MEPIVHKVFWRVMNKTVEHTDRRLFSHCEARARLDKTCSMHWKDVTCWHCLQKKGKR